MAKKLDRSVETADPITSAYPVESVAISTLNEAAYNPRKISREQLERLKGSIRQWGFVDPIIANRTTGNIVGGHQRVKAARALGLEDVPVVWVELDDANEKALNVALNKHGGEWDAEALPALLDEITAAGIELELTGFTAEELDDMIADLGVGSEAANGLTDADEVPDEPEIPITKHGDMWLLGSHRLLCGDSTKSEDMMRLMGEKKADMVWTDPPYGVSYQGKTKDKLTIINDDLNQGDLDRLLEKAFDCANSSCRAGAVWYVAATPGPKLLSFAKTLQKLQIWKQTLVWVKQRFVLGMADYHYKHETIFYGWSSGAAHYYCGDRTQDNVWEFPCPNRSALHPTMKPVELIEKSIKNSSKPGWLVLDPFGGSGSTLIAAERTGRSAFLMEIDPKYCDVIVSRWELFTGKKARLEA